MLFCPKTLVEFHKPVSGVVVGSKQQIPDVPFASLGYSCQSKWVC